MCNSRRGKRGYGPHPPPPPGKLQKYGIPSNTGPDPFKITKQPIQHSMLGHNQPISKTQFKWRFAGGPLMARYCGIWILPPLTKLKTKKKQKKKNVV